MARVNRARAMARKFRETSATRKPPLQLRISPELHARIEEARARERRRLNLSAVCEAAIAAYLDELER